MTMEKELEEWKEKCHHLTLKLNGLQQTYQTEAEYAKDEIAAKEKELKEIGDTLKAEFVIREKKLKEQISDLQDFVQESRDQISLMKGQSDQQLRTIEQLRSTESDRLCRNEISESQKIREDQLAQELKSAHSLLESQQEKFHNLIQVTEQQKGAIEELKEEMDSKDMCISQLQTRMREMESEREEEEALAQALQIQNHTDDEFDPSKRGNSLFSELEERRLRVEEELVRLRARIARLTVENLDLKSSLERGDSRSAIIVTQLQTISHSEHELVQALRQLKSECLDLFQGYDDRFVALTNEYNRKLLQFRNGLDMDHPQLPELEMVRGERDRLLAQKIGQDRELFEYRKELKQANHQKTAGEANIRILRVKLQALQDQFNESRYRSNGEASDSSSGSLNNSLSTTTRIRNKNCVGGDATISNDEDWLRQGILDETMQQLERVKANAASAPAAPSPKPKPMLPKSSRAEEIPDCNQQ